MTNTSTRALILSSSEALPIARYVQKSLSKLSDETIKPTVWEEVHFSGWLLQDMIQQIGKYPFVIVVLSCDDSLKHRDQDGMVAPRDNLWVEYGISLVMHGFDNVFLLSPNIPNLKIPTDLMGLYYYEYEMYEDEQQEVAIYDSCAKIVRRLNKLVNQGLRIPPILFHRAVDNLNDQIMSVDKRGLRPDIVIGVNHGGAILGSLLYYKNRKQFYFTVFWASVESSVKSSNIRHDEFRQEIHDLATQYMQDKSNQMNILLVDDTLRTGKAMSKAIDIVNQVFPQCTMRIATIIYRPDLARDYKPETIDKIIYTPQTLDYSVGLYDHVFYE